jgi:hypothetical protein
MENIKYSESFLKNKDKLPPDIKNGIENVIEEVTQRNFTDALEYLKKPKIGGSRPKVVDDRLHLPKGKEYYHFYTNGFENTYRVLYLVNHEDSSFTFRRIVSPKDHGYIAEVALLDLKSLKYTTNQYISVDSKLNSGKIDKKKNLYFDIDDSQKTIIDKLLKSNTNYFILGGAGTGKTITAIELFKRAQLINNGVVYITFTSNLLKDTKDKLLMSGSSTKNCYTFNEYFLKNAPESREVHLKIVEECIHQLLNDFPSISSLFIDQPSFFDKNFIYSLIRGFVTGGLNPKNNYEKYNINDSISISRMKALIDLNHLPDETSNQIVEAITLIIKHYLEEKEKHLIYDDNDFNVIPETRPNYIIVDEFQDFTEYQIATILKTSLNSRVDFFGDPQQVINPTFFDVERLRNIIQNIGFKKPDILNLMFNYRSTEELQEFSNHLIDIRKRTLRKNDFNLSESEKVDGAKRFVNLKKNPFSVARLHDKRLIFKLFKSLSSAADTTIIVNDSDEKLELIKEYNLDEDSVRKFIFTIQEYKGLENSNIIVYNLLHENEKSFVELLTKKHGNSKFYEEIFNKLYVAITRSIKSVILCEAEPLNEVINNELFFIPYDLKKEKYKEISIINTTDEFKNYIDFSEDSNDYFDSADKFVKSSKLLAGIEKYIQGLTILLASFEELEKNDYLKFLKSKQVFNDYQKIVSNVVTEIFNHPEIYLEGLSVNIFLKDLMNQSEKLKLPQIYYTTAQLIFKSKIEVFDKVKILEIFENILNWGSLSSLPTLTNFYDNQIRIKDHSINLNKSTIKTIQDLNQFFGVGKGFSFSNMELLEPSIVAKDVCVGIARKFALHKEFYDYQVKKNPNFFSEFNDAEFLYELALHLEEVDRKFEAASILEIAASKGNLKSIYFVGKNYLYGNNTEVDINKAIYYLKQAVKHFDYQATYELGVIYNDESLEVYSPTMAFELFKTSHKNYIFEASLELAKMYELGKGTEKQLLEAYTIYKSLSDRGFAYAESKLKDNDFLFAYASELETLGYSYDSNFRKALIIYEELSILNYQPAIKKLTNNRFCQSVFEYYYFNSEFGKAITQCLTFSLEKNIRNLHILMLSYYKVNDLKKCFNSLDEIQHISSRSELIGFVEGIDYKNNVFRINIKAIHYGTYGEKDLFLRKVYFKSDKLMVQRFDLVLINLSKYKEEAIRNDLILDKSIYVSEMLVFSKLRILSSSIGNIS